MNNPTHVNLTAIATLPHERKALYKNQIVDVFAFTNAEGKSQAYSAWGPQGETITAACEDFQILNSLEALTRVQQGQAGELSGATRR